MSKKKVDQANGSHEADSKKKDSESNTKKPVHAIENPANTVLQMAMSREMQKFEDCYVWLEESMPPVFFDEVPKESISLVAHGLIGFDQQEYFCTINLKGTALVMCLDSPDADLRVLKNFATYGIQNYQCYISSKPPPTNCSANLRIAVIHFTEALLPVDKPYPADLKEQLRGMVLSKDPAISSEDFDKLFSAINTSFLRALPIDCLTMALDMFFRAKTRDNCQYEVRYNDNWEAQNEASMQIVLAWKNTPKFNFLYKLAALISRHNLMMKKVNATYINPYSRESILTMVLDLHGADGSAAWDAANAPDFLRDLATVKYFAEADLIDSQLVSKGVISGNEGNLLRSMAIFIHQTLVHLDPNLYTVERIKEDLCRHPEFTVKIIKVFTFKFHPTLHSEPQFVVLADEFENDINKLDTGLEEIDIRRKNIFKQALSFVKHTLKTNFFRLNYTAMSFRLDPKYLDEVPFDRTKKFPELPYAIFFIRGMHSFGFHIRFKDLARGGLRTVYLEQSEHLQQESNNVFTECYNLALTQHMKNKDIPEGGAKGVIFLKPWNRLASETLILQNELTRAGTPEEAIKDAIAAFRKDQKEEYLYHAQRSFVEGLITLVNCDPDGRIRAKNIIDYWKKPEYIYLGPDENMHDCIISWIADFSKKYNYKPGRSFISGKPEYGINHKEYGVTSLGVNVYMEAVLHFLGINPRSQNFTVKISGGPDGDVAGNEILNLQKYYPKTVKVIALTDISGTIYDAQGLDLPILVELFRQGRAIKYYPPTKLSNGGFLLDREAKRSQTAFAQQTLCWRMIDNNLVEDWLSGSEMNQLWRNNVHQVKTDIFIPAGGRPRTLSETTVSSFLDETGQPTAKAIIEGANLYLTPKARRILEKLGVLIIKDSSANKTGVICSSFEVLCGLALGDEKFLALKDTLVKEILNRLTKCAANEANLLLYTHQQTGEYLTDISAEISERINLFTYQLLDYLEPLSLTNDPKDPLMSCFFDYCLPTLSKNFQQELLQEIPEQHKKAIIAAHLGAQLVYSKGLSWWPSVVDILPVLLEIYPKNNRSKTAT